MLDRDYLRGSNVNQAGAMSVILMARYTTMDALQAALISVQPAVPLIGETNHLQPGWGSCSQP